VQVAVADLLPAHRRLRIETRRPRGRLMTRRHRTATGSCSCRTGHLRHRDPGRHRHL